MKGILTDSDFEILVNVKWASNGLITGGLVVGTIDFQRCRMIIEAQKGEFKEYPTLGFGIDNYLKSQRKRQQFINELTKELKSDGMTTAKVVVGDDLSQFTIDL